MNHKRQTLITFTVTHASIFISDLDFILLKSISVQIGISTKNWNMKHLRLISCNILYHSKPNPHALLITNRAAPSVYYRVCNFWPGAKPPLPKYTQTHFFINKRHFLTVLVISLTLKLIFQNCWLKLIKFFVVGERNI